MRGYARSPECVKIRFGTALMCELRQNRAKEWALQRLTTIGEACRALLRENLRTTLEWAFRQVTEHGQTVDRVMVRLGIG